MNKLTAIVSLLLTASSLRADCPTPQFGYWWPQLTQILYAFRPNNPPPCWQGESITGLGIDGDINAAFYQWSTQNGNGTSFAQTQPYGDNFTVWAQSVVVFSDCGVWDAAYTTIGIIAGSNIIGQAETVFYLGSYSRSTPSYANYDPSAGNYHEFIQKVMTHEIGHTMNLSDQPGYGGACDGQVAGQSIMNEYCGTNDMYNNLPTPSFGPFPACDNASIR
jgi:hypothetical protein